MPQRFNLRATCINHNGASTTYTWRDQWCADEAEAHATARQWGASADRHFKGPDPLPPYQTKEIRTELVPDEVLAAEDEAHIREKVEFEMFCGGYDD